ncbi:MAG: Por secretion system protein, partial [Prevotella copri]|nr:Por secretion system protein [Segatella copri]
HSLYESDGYSYYHGGRNLFDAEELKVGDEKKVVITNTTGSAIGKLSVALTTATNSKAQILKNGKALGEITLSIKDDGSAEEIKYLKATERVATYSISDFQDKDTISIKVLSGASIRLDYISVTWAEPRSCAFTAANLASGGKIPAAQYVYGITNQNHHADGAADMVIIIPTSQKLLKQAQRLKEFHEQHDGLRVTIVPADELYNEFSSGTPDANAYRRYLRMLSDKAQSEADMPKYLLLFGDCVWDNRMLTSGCRILNPDDYLLCFESENSFSAVDCFVSDSWFGMLGEGAGLYPSRELQDVAVGRFPVTYAEEAKVLVDKTISYAQNANVGAWQNTLMFMGDDGNGNLHMQDADDVANDVLTTYPAYLVKKVMWDAYTRETSSTGNTYPEATKIIKQQQAAGALIMDYAGHGDPTQISHESVLKLNDFADFRNTNLPLWVTASCDIMPFDGLDANIGEYALLNDKGGAVAFYGTTRTVSSLYNKYINRAFIYRVLSLVDGKPVTMGEAHRLAQNDLVSGNGPTPGSDVTVNHLNYSLLGDPALALNLPKYQIVVDSINGIPVAESETLPMLKAGSVARMAGHIEGADDFRGVITAIVRDSEETVTCRLNNTDKDGAENAFEYKDRTKTLYQGTDSVRGGKFAFSFAVPLDINYSNQSGLVNLYAVNTAKTLSAHGSSEQFTVGESEEQKNDSIGPSIYCYLNSPSFADGGKVNTTPFFVAKITDKDGINVAGSGIGHDLQLVIDGDMSKTYVLNSNFTYDFGTYTSGSTYYSIPELEPGSHELTFRAWDIQNNSSTVKLRFNVVKGLSPALFDVGVTANPAKTSTTFIISHDRTESDMDVVVEVFDSSGRQHWRHSESGVPASGSYTVNWDLTSDSGTPLGTGVYLYRVKVASDGSSYTSKVKKLIIIK